MAFSYGWRGPNIVKDGLILYVDAGSPNSFPLVNSSTTWKDISGNANNGTLTNGPTFSSGNGGSIVFDGIDDYTSLNFINPFQETIIIWVKSNTATWNENGWISSSRRQNGHIIHPNQGTAGVGFYILNSTAGFTLIGTISPSSITSPNMYCMTTNGSNSHKIYLNGSLQTTNTTSITRTTTPTAQIYEIAKDDTVARYGNGTYYNVLRYNRELSATEILQNYNATKGRYL
jgi:hypothetical protein